MVQVLLQSRLPSARRSAPTELNADSFQHPFQHFAATPPNSFGLTEDRFTRRHPPSHLPKPASIRFGDAAEANQPPLPAIVIPSLSPRQALIALLVKKEGASDTFVSYIQGCLEMRMQTPLLEALVNDGYTLSLKSYVTQNRQDLADSQALNYTGGLNEPESKRTTVAETIHIKNTDPPDWQLNRFWQNSVIHELGHALADIIGRQKAAAMTNPDEAELKAKVEKWGASELPEFTTAWQADYDQMPKEVQEMWLPIGYYVSVGKDGKRTVSRQETFAETFDILVRGKYSTYNHDNFQQYFPRTLQAVANLIENHFQLPPLPYRPNLKKD